MRTVKVWAPNASELEVAFRAHRVSMVRAADDWWTAEVELQAGDDYAFRIDGGEPLPDPRSGWQPYGVHGWSRVVDHSAFRWSDAAWDPPEISCAIIYELHIGTFSEQGTFEAAIHRLDYLKDLGITHVELMPVAEFSGDRGWGYDGVALFAPHHAYGGPDGLKQFVNACHQRGLPVILDVVYNHFGPSGNYLPRYGQYLTNRYSTPWGDGVNFDGPGSDEVRRFFCDNAAMWFRDYHIDGLRLDAVHAIVDNSALTFIEQLAEQTARISTALGKRLALIAESDQNDPRLVRSSEQGGDGLEAMWCDDFHHALHTLLTGERSGYYADFGSMADLAKALQQGFVFDGCYSRYRVRTHGRRPRGLSGHQMVAFAQNHDQVGNRARGDRLCHLVSTGRAKIAEALVFCGPLIPLIFQGEEWCASTPFIYFSGHEDAGLARAVTEGRRREFARFQWPVEEIPDPQDPVIFMRSKLNWNELGTEPHREMLEWYRDLVRLRQSTPALRDGRLERVNVRFDEGAQWLVVEREPITLACNLSPRRRTLLLDGGTIIGRRPESTVLLGISADHPETSYGWIEPGEALAAEHSTIRRVRRFWEKPSTALAQQLHSRGCLWNSFVIVARASTLLGLMVVALPDVYRSFQKLHSSLDKGAEARAIYKLYGALDSVDFSHDVLEKAPLNLSVLPVRGVEWSDLGEPGRVIGILSKLGIQANWEAA